MTERATQTQLKLQRRARLVELLIELAELLREEQDAQVPTSRRIAVDHSEFDSASIFVWNSSSRRFDAVERFSAVDLKLLVGIEPQVEVVLKNTRQFVGGYSANNILLWGARGTGKSSCVKAVYATVSQEEGRHGLVLVQVNREDLGDLAYILRVLEEKNRPTIIFCDDLVFEQNDDDYKFLKVVLDGGLRRRPDNVILYATSNRRHIVSRQTIENEQSTALLPHESVEEKVALSDRFGLWVGFHPFTQQQFEEAVLKYADYYNLPVEKTHLTRQAQEWSLQRGGRSGRVAAQFISDLAGCLKVAISGGH
jgi:uncharacterized protein